MDGQTDRPLHIDAVSTQNPMFKKTRNGLTDGPMDQRTHRPTDLRTYGPTDGPTDRQTLIYRCVEASKKECYIINL